MIFAFKVKKCDIDSIANYLIKISNEKNFQYLITRVIMKKKVYNIAIVGLGIIGSYLFNFLNNNKNNLSNKNNANFKLLYVSAKNRNKKEI